MLCGPVLRFSAPRASQGSGSLLSLPGDCRGPTESSNCLLQRVQLLLCLESIS